MMVDCNPSVELLPMERFMHDLVRRSSGLMASSSKESLQRNSAKSVMDFDIAAKGSNKDKSSDMEGNGSSHSNAGDTFDINGLVLVSDNARVFANARPQRRAPLPSNSWHSSSELRKARTAKSRWGGTPDSSPRAQSKAPRNFPSANSRFGPPSRSMTRRTSDSCLAVPTRSWMKPPRRTKDQGSQDSQLISSQAMQNVRARRLGQPTPPSRPCMQQEPSHPLMRTSQSMGNVRDRRIGQPMPPSLPERPSSALVASKFAASPLEAALEARRSSHSRPPPPKPTDSNGSMDSSSSLKSFGSCGSDEDLLHRASKVVNRPPRISALDSRHLITCAKTSQMNANTANSSWSTHGQERKGRRRAPQHNIMNANNKVLSNASIPRHLASQLPAQQKQPGFAPIPASLLLPYDRFQADAPNTDSSGSLSSNDSRREPRLSTTRSRRSQNSLGSAGSSGSRTNLSRTNLSRSSLSRNSMVSRGSSRTNLLGSRSYHNYGNSNSSFAKNGLRSQSDHYSTGYDRSAYSPISTLELALGDMAPKRRTTKGRKAVGRSQSSDY